MNEDRLREVFDMFDCDQSGFITADEIKKMLGGGEKQKKTPKPKNSANIVDSLIASIDKQDRLENSSMVGDSEW